MPIRQIKCGAKRSIRRPRKRMAPFSAAKGTLVTMLNNVLLPLPLGPAMPKTSPSSTVKLIPSTARKAPKCFDTSSTSRIAVMTAPCPRSSTRRRSLQPIGRAKLAGGVSRWIEQHALALPDLIELDRDEIVALFGEMRRGVENYPSLGCLRIRSADRGADFRALRRVANLRHRGEVYLRLLVEGDAIRAAFDAPALFEFVRDFRGEGVLGRIQDAAEEIVDDARRLIRGELEELGNRGRVLDEHEALGRLFHELAHERRRVGRLIVGVDHDVRRVLPHLGEKRMPVVDFAE